MNLKNSKVFFLICMVSILLAGCGSDKRVKTEPVHEEEIANLDELLQENGIGSYEVKAVVEKENSAYVLMETWGDDSQGQVIYQVKDTEVSWIANWEIEEGTITKTMDVDTVGNFYILEEQQKNETVHTNIKRVECGKESVEEISLDTWIEKNDSVQFIQLDGVQNLYLFFESGKIMVLSADLQWVRNITGHEREYLIDAARLQDGNIIFVSAKYKGDQEILSLYEVEKEAGTTKELLVLPEGRYGSKLLFSGTGIYDYYIKGENEILGGIREQSSLTPVIRLQDADIVSSEIQFVCALAEGKLFAVKESETVDLIYIAKGRKKGEEEKEVLYLASLDSDSVMEKEVADFNKHNKNYRIELKNYGDYEEPVQSFLVDLATGAEIDMVEFPPEEADKLIAKGIFADLYPFIDSDITLQREDFYGNMLKAFEYEGKLYQSVSFVHLYGWVTRKSHLSEFGRWDFESFQSYIEHNPGDNIFTDTSVEEILKQMIMISSNELLDWDQKTCHFETGTFEDILKLAKQYGSNSSQISLEDKVPALIDNRLLFVETPLAIEDLYMYSEALGEDMAVVASPFTEHLGANLYSTMPQLGMIAKSSRQDGAWQFVRRFFTRQYQDISDDDKFLQSRAIGFPVRKDCMENLIQRFTATEDYEKDGKWYTALKPNDYSISWDGYDIEVGPLGKSEEELLRELLSNASWRQGIDPTIQDIIMEESKAYFDGEKDAEAVAKIIQNRVSIYMNE